MNITPRFKADEGNFPQTAWPNILLLFTLQPATSEIFDTLKLM